MIIRKIKIEDNQAIEKIIRDIFIELDLPLVGTAYADKATTMMFESYQADNDDYFILEVDGEVMGGVGYQQLTEEDTSICEIQKMYISPKVRGSGYGKVIFEHCLEAAKKQGYQQCYLETLTELEAAVHIYEKYGFERLEAPLGNTGHSSCGVYMLLLF